MSIEIADLRQPEFCFWAPQHDSIVIHVEAADRSEAVQKLKSLLNEIADVGAIYRTDTSAASVLLDRFEELPPDQQKRFKGMIDG